MNSLLGICYDNLTSGAITTTPNMSTSRDKGQFFVDRHI